MSINELFFRMKEFHERSGVSSVPQSSVVSPLFPGQFNYCLDEIHLYKKYGDLINITEDEHFQKIQPAIRLADYDRFFTGAETSKYHLGTFTISTMNGGHIVPIAQEEETYRESVTGVLDFLTNHLGLEKDKILMSYFSGNATAKEVEMSRKKSGQLLKVDVDFDIPADALSKKTLLENGLTSTQLLPNNTRDNFLTINWNVQKPLIPDQYIRAPWGYRNEIFYRLNNGDLLDIATIERLTIAPIVENRHGINFVVGVEPWHRCFVIDGCGLERLEIASSNLASVFELTSYKELLTTGATPLQIESVRILHRIFTDSSCQEITSVNRRKKMKKIARNLQGISLNKIRQILQLNADVYRIIFPELSDGIEWTIKGLLLYRHQQE